MSRIRRMRIGSEQAGHRVSRTSGPASFFRAHRNTRPFLSSAPYPGPWNVGRNVLYCKETMRRTLPKDEKTSARLPMESSKRMAVPSGAGSDYARNRARRPPADDYDALPENVRVRRMAPVAAAAAAEPVDRRSHALSESGLYRTRRGKRSVEKPAAGTDGNRGYAQRYRISVSRPDRPALPRRPPVFPTGDFAGSLPHASRNSRAERHAAGHRASGTEPEKHFPDRSLQPEPPRKRAGLRPLCRAGLSRRNEHRRLHRSHKLSPVAIGI